MYCANCGAGAESGANFCTKCGARLPSHPEPSVTRQTEPSGFGSLCESLVSELDGGRQGWFSSLKDHISSSNGRLPSIVNSELSEAVDVGALGRPCPEIFIFNTLNGVSAEATAIAWQVEVAVSFATNQQYIEKDRGHEFLIALTQSVFFTSKSLSPVWGPRWILAMQMVMASFERAIPIDDETLALILSHFLLNEKDRTPGVLRMREELLSTWVLFLRGFTFFGTCRTFGDMEAAEKIRKSLGL